MVRAVLPCGLSFTAYTYAGELPSCAFGFNSHGLVVPMEYKQYLYLSNKLHKWSLKYDIYNIWSFLPMLSNLFNFGPRLQMSLLVKRWVIIFSQHQSELRHCSSKWYPVRIINFMSLLTGLLLSLLKTKGQLGTCKWSMKV